MNVIVRTSLPIAVLLALVCATAHGQQQLWRSYVDLEGRAGEVREIGQANLFLPLWQDDSQLVFADLRGNWTDSQTAQGNLGLACRRMLPSDWILGVYGFYDLQHRRQAGNHQQATVGAELLNVDWGLRMNGYIPDRRAEEFAPLNTAFLQNNNIVIRRGEERAYYGIDFEVERLLWSRTGAGFTSGDSIIDRLHSLVVHLDAEIWAAVGAFHFDNDTPGFDNITGPRARVDLRLYDLALLGEDSRVAASGQYEYDDVRGGVATAMLTVRVPFGPRWRGGPKLTGLDRRMVTPIVRDDVITNIGLSPVAEPANFARTGAAISQAVMVDANTADPEAAIEAAGPDSVAIADGSAGTIFTPGTIDLNPGQVLLGSGSPLSVVGANSGAAATFVAAGTRPLIRFDGIFNVVNAFANVSAADNACVQGVDLVTTGDFVSAVEVFNSEDVLLRDVGLFTSGFGASAIFSQGTSQFSVNDSEIATFNQSAHGILAFDNTRFDVNNSVFTTFADSANGIAVGGATVFNARDTQIFTSGVDANGIFSTEFTTFQLINVDLTTTGDAADGIQSIDNSRYIVSGGNILTTGASSRGIFAVSTAGFTQALRVNTANINSSDDGILLAGVFTGAGEINAQINGSTIVAALHEIDVLVDGTAIVCLNAFGNIPDNGLGTINLDTFATGTINVTELEPTADVNLQELDDANRIPFFNVFQSGTGVINFNAGPCPTP